MLKLPHASLTERSLSHELEYVMIKLAHASLTERSLSHELSTLFIAIRGPGM